MAARCASLPSESVAFTSPQQQRNLLIETYKFDPLMVRWGAVSAQRIAQQPATGTSSLEGAVDRRTVPNSLLDLASGSLGAFTRNAP